MKTNYKIKLQPGDHARRHDMTEAQYRECVRRFFDDGMPEGGERVGSWSVNSYFGWDDEGLFHSGNMSFEGRLLTHAEIMAADYEAEVGDVFEVTKCELAGARLGVGSKVTVEECNGRGGFFVDTSNMLFNDHINNGLKHVGRMGELQKDNTRLGWHVSNETTREQILSTVFGHSLFGIGRPDIPEPQYDPTDVAFKPEEKTVSDAVDQENGIWATDYFNAMAFLSGEIDYCSIDEHGKLHHGGTDGLNDPMSSDWHLVCTRAEFEREAMRRKLDRVRCDAEKTLDDAARCYSGGDVAEWSGDGLPPVGAICEASMDFDRGKDGTNWNKIEVLYSDKSTVVGRIIEGAHYPEYSNGFETNLYRFRPIKSPRDRWVEEAMKQCRTLSKHDCQAIYDAGLAGGVE